MKGPFKIERMSFSVWWLDYSCIQIPDSSLNFYIPGIGEEKEGEEVTHNKLEDMIKECIKKLKNIPN